MWECPVCLEEDRIKKRLNCSHEVCEECIIQLEKHKIDTCPLCRACIKPEVVKRKRRRDISHEEFRQRRLAARAASRIRGRWKAIRMMKTLGCIRDPFLEV